MAVVPVLPVDAAESGAAAPAERESVRPTRGYLPTLDGWRAIAIFAVIQYHDGLHRLGPVSNRWLHEKGYQGVDLFFAISGFLICSRLLDEDRKRGSISLKGFYIRRSFRIMPAAWLYLAVYALLSLANVLPRDWGGVLTSLFMVRNLWIAHAGDSPNHWYTIHFWSLSVEEHFYLLLPGLLVLFPRRRLLVTGVLAALATAWSITIIRVAHLQSPAVWLRTDDRLSQLMVPAFFAILAAREDVRRQLVRWLRPWVAFLIFAAMQVAAPYFRVAIPLAVIVGFPLIVMSTVYHPLSWTSRLLELPFLKFVGRISYSLYLWQQLFFLLGHHQPATWPLSALQTSPFSYFAAFTLAWASYEFVERPIIRLGHKFATH